MMNQIKQPKYVRLPIRVVVALTMLGAAVVAQAAAIRYFEGGEPLPVAGLSRPLGELPMNLEAWHAREIPADDPRLNFATDHLWREYVHRTSGQHVTVWIAYSTAGADRRHHPEICMAVAGQQEDRRARQAFRLPPDPRPIRQYRFRGAKENRWLFYWYYTLRAGREAKPETWRRFYQQIRQRPASLTIEVFAPESFDNSAEQARRFVALLDRALQEQLPSRAVRGSQPLPVAVVPGTQT